MEKMNLVKGFTIHMPDDFDHLCAGCAHGKSHQLPLQVTSTNKYSKMELLVMDLTGPMTVPTWDGHLYALVVVEASCRYPVGQLLKEKEEVGTTVQDIVAMLECQSGLKACHF
jgi:hypothetical protein